MAEYESIHGTRVRYLSSDPTLTDSSTEGQVWYNSTSGANKALVQIKAWSSGGNMGTARYLIGSCGAQDAALGFGGYSGSNKNQTEEYSGFTWRAGGNLNTARWGMGGAGSQTAGLAAGGFVSAASALTEEYDGSSWTAQNTMPTAMRDTTAAGTQTAAVTCGGSPPSGGVSGVTQEYDGTNWTTSPGSMSVARSTATAFGLQTAAIVAGGNEPGINSAEQYDGTNWTSINNLNSPVYSLASAANGTTSHGITFGGASPAGTGLTQTEEWDGNTWIISPASLASGKWKLGGAGNASAGLKFGGGPPPSGNVATEEYSSSVNVETTGAWASGGTLNTTRSTLSIVGTSSTSMLAVGGYRGGGPSPQFQAQNNVESYNGSSWTNASALPIYAMSGFGMGTTTAGLHAGGAENQSPPHQSTNKSQEYNGSSWTAGGTMTQTQQLGASAGTQTAGLLWAGQTGNPPTSDTNVAQEYNGSSWTAGGSHPVSSITRTMGSGTQTAAINFGGHNDPPADYATTFFYNGSSWTAGPNMALARNAAMGAGTQTLAICGGGYMYSPPPGSTAATEWFDGSSWSNIANNAVSGPAAFAGPGGSAASNSLALVNNVAYEWTGQPESKTTASTLTTS